jgi:hypothetical protein
MAAGGRLKRIEKPVRGAANEGRRADAKPMRHRFRSHLFADALVLEEVSRWLRFKHEGATKRPFAERLA